MHRSNPSGIHDGGPVDALELGGLKLWLRAGQGLSKHMPEPGCRKSLLVEWFQQHQISRSSLNDEGPVAVASDLAGIP